MKFETIIFDRLPEHDTCWSLITGTDGMLYIGVCGEMTGGLSAFIASYDPQKQKVDYLLEMADALGVPPELGEAAQAKIHYSLVSDEEGVLYAATHCTGAPLGDGMWRPWNCWTHPVKHFRASGLAVYDPHAKKLLFTDWLMPNEGTRCMAISNKRRMLYGISYPRNHFFTYHIDTRRLNDLGRIGSINPQCIFLDRGENAYTADDYGNIIRCDGDREELEETGVQIPHAPFRNGFHNVPYDAAPSPDGESVYGLTWTFGERLFSYHFKQNKLVDFGKACGEENGEWFHIINSHAGGLVFGSDGNLYFTANIPSARGKPTPHLIVFNPDNGRREIIGEIACDGKPADHISRSAADFNGNLYFAEVGNRPTKLFKYAGAAGKKFTGKIMRHWG
ncbi:MAG: hypothetical protein PHP98_11085 [Kiritimatiellae bacterium]|nr:hypothetical protein [Kiritimatiellia bacterium]